LRGIVVSGMFANNAIQDKIFHGERLRPAGCGRHPAGHGVSRVIRESAAIALPDSSAFIANNRLG